MENPTLFITGGTTMSKVEIMEEIASASKEKGLYHYLYGATGSGKTEVFLSAAEKILEKGQGVLYLVPEIGLTPQVVSAVTRKINYSGKFTFFSYFYFNGCFTCGVGFC